MRFWLIWNRFVGCCYLVAGALIAWMAIAAEGWTWWQRVGLFVVGVLGSLYSAAFKFSFGADTPDA